MTFERKMGIGGSDIAAILGLSPFRTPFDVWLEKTGDPAFKPQEETPQMRFGTLMEPVLARVYEEEHPGTKIVPMGGAHSEPIWHPNKIAYAHIDGIVTGEPAAISGPQNGIWEGKTAWDDRDWRDGVPIYYETQVRHYLAITGEPWCDITICFRQSAAFRHFRVDANPEIDAGLIEVGLRFWTDHVLTLQPPPIDGSVGAAAYLVERFPKAQQTEVLASSPEVDRLAGELALARSLIAENERIKAKVENAIKEEMGEYGKITGTGWSATWNNVKGRTTVGWQEVASAYRGLLHQVERALEAGRSEEALRLFTDNPPDGIVGLYTVEGAPSRRFVFTESGKGDF